MLQDTVVIEGEVSLINRIDGDPEVIIVEGGGQSYPHYQGDYTVAPSLTEQILETDGMVMDNDVTVEAVPQGSATTPATIITADPTISVSSGGLITAQVNKTQQVTPTVQEGYVEEGTPGNVGVSGSNTQQLTTQGAQTIHPASTDQSIASGKYLTGAQTFKAVTVSGLTADKVLQGNVVKIGDADDDDRIMSVTGTASGGGGYSIEDIIERNISGDIVYNSGTQTDLKDGLFQATSITSFSSTKITDAEMGRRSFSHNTALKSVSMPNLAVGSNTLKMVETFLNCTALETLYLPRIGTNWGNSMCEGCSSLTDVNIDACVTLPQSTFRNCNALTELDLPNCTKMMNTSAECHSLTALILRSSSVCALNNQNALQNTPLRGFGGTYSGHVYVPSSLIASYKTASNWSSIYAAYNDIFRAIEGSEYE